MDPGLLDRAFDTLASTARLSGAYRTVSRALLESLGDSGSPRSSGTPVTVLDVGAGRGDLLMHLQRVLAGRGIGIRAIGGDRHPGALALARSHRDDAPGAPGLVRLAASRLPLATGSVDYVVSTVTLHHLGRSEAARFLAEAQRVSRRGWIVVDLRRSPLTYLAVRLLAETAWRGNPLPRHDGPISVRRSFRVPEIRELLLERGLMDARVSAEPPLHVTVRGGELVGGGRR